MSFTLDSQSLFNLWVTEFWAGSLETQMSGILLDFNVLINSKLGTSPERYSKEYYIVII